MGKTRSLERNLFAGPVLPVLGNLVDLENLILNANNFTAELPANLTNLTKLRKFWISSNNFTGRVPDFFQSWKQFQYLYVIIFPQCSANFFYPKFPGVI